MKKSPGAPRPPSGIRWMTTKYQKSGHRGARTPDPGLIRPMLYHLSYATTGVGISEPGVIVFHNKDRIDRSIYKSKMRPTGVEPITFGFGIRCAAVAPRSRMLMHASTKMREQRVAHVISGWSRRAHDSWAYPGGRDATGAPFRVVAPPSWTTKAPFGKNFPHRDLNPGLSRERRRC